MEHRYQSLKQGRIRSVNAVVEYMKSNLQIKSYAIWFGGAVDVMKRNYNKISLIKRSASKFFQSSTALDIEDAYWRIHRKYVRLRS